MVEIRGERKKKEPDIYQGGQTSSMNVVKEATKMLDVIVSTHLQHRQ